MFKVRRELPLIMGNRPLFVIDDDVKEQIEELDEFISDIRYMNTLRFSREVLFSHEIQANNFIEAYRDDVETIYEVIHRKSKITDSRKKQRIMNLYRGYKYILERKDINKDNLRDLYALLSKDLLSEEDRANMGEYYRKNPVYIFYSYRAYDRGVPGEEVEDFMNILFDYINSPSDGLSKCEIFLKSQIIHFYFVYIHPYYDINGRTSRTTSMWYLLKNKAYPFIIFNRAIQLCKSEYYSVIRDTRKFANITYFLNYMMSHTRVELEKDYIMNMIKNSCNSELTSVDYQTLRYILSMKGVITYADFIHFYNSQNEVKKYLDIFNDMIVPLVDKGILVEGRATNKLITTDTPNHVFGINGNLFENDPSKIKKLDLSNKVL